MGKIATEIAKALQDGEARQEKREVKKVAKKVKKVEAEEAEETAAPAKKGGKAAKKVVKAEKANGKAAKKGDGESRGPNEIPEGHVSVAQLAEEAEITAQSARVKLRASDIERPEGRWVWPEGSKALKKAREILGL